MALPLSTDEIINELRARFLRSSQINSTSEIEHRHRRIIQPHILDPDDYDEEDDDIKYLLSRVDSPPIPINVLENTELVRRLKTEHDIKPKVLQKGGLSYNEDAVSPLDNEQNSTIIEPEVETLTHSFKAHTPNPHDLLTRKDDISSVVTLKLNPSCTQSDSTNISLNSEKTTNTIRSSKIPLINSTNSQKFVPNFTKLFRGRSFSNSSQNESKRRGSSSKRSSTFNLGFNHDDSFDSPDDEDNSGYEFDDDGDDASLVNVVENDNKEEEKEKRILVGAAIKDNDEPKKPNNLTVEKQNYDKQDNTESNTAPSSSCSTTTAPSHPYYYNDYSKYLLFENDDSDSDFDSDDNFLLDSDFSVNEDRLNPNGFEIRNTFDDSSQNILHKSNISTSLGLASSFVRSTFVRNLDQDGNVSSIVRVNDGQSNIRKKRGLRRLGSSYSSSSSNVLNRLYHSEVDLSEDNEVDINKESTLQISKQDITHFNSDTTVTESKLTSMINSTDKASVNPLIYFNFVDGTSIKDDQEIIKLVIHIPPKKLTNTVQFVIRKDVTVFETIGFLILKLSEDEKNRSLFEEAEDLNNPNHWSLFMFDEDDYDDSDDEPEDEFALLDRLKTIGSYGIDEVSLGKVDSSHFKKNEQKTPLPIFEETTSPSAQTIETTNSTSSAITNTSKTTNGYNYTTMFQPETSHNQNQYEQGDTTTVELHVTDYEELSNEVIMKLQITNKISDILLGYAQVKHISPSDYNLKLKHESKFFLNLKDTISSLDGFQFIQIVSKIKSLELGLIERPMDPTQNQLPTLTADFTLQTLKLQDKPDEQYYSDQITPQTQRPTQGQRLRNFSNPISKNKSRKPPPSLQQALAQINSFNPSTGQNNEYHKYKVWRRLPMSFINRHERTFAIDGEYIYILPSDTKYQNFQDSKSTHTLKTINCHISQLKTCKISKKNPQNFKVVLIRGNGPKRYDFEAVSSQEALEIVNRLKGAVGYYKANITGSNNTIK